MEATHKVTLGNETRFVDATTYQDVVASFVAANGGSYDGIKITELDDRSLAVAAPVGDTKLALDIETKPLPAPAPIVRGETVDATGATRSTVDMLLAKANGFAPAQPIYTRGTMLLDVGVENAKLSRIEHEAKPLTADACVTFIQRVQAEERRDVLAPFKNLRMRENGLLALVEEGKRGTNFGPMTDRGFRSLLTQAGIGGHAYLASIPAQLRAININHHMAGANGIEVPSGEVKLRTRRTHGGREIFGVVSPKYTAFDADLIATEVIEAVSGTEARGSVVYDGERARFEAIWHSDVQPQDYVAGEFFKAGIVVRTADDGSGSCRVSAVVWQNLCKNLIIIDEATQDIARIRHVGKVENMADRLRAALEAAQSKVAGFVVKWGYACNDKLTTSETTAIEDVIPGFFNGVIERDLVPVRGRRQDVVRSLVTMYDKDQSGATKQGFTRAALVNAFTRWAHEVNTDPWLEDEVQRAAGLIAQSTEPLPFEAIALKG